MTRYKFGYLLSTILTLLFSIAFGLLMIVITNQHKDAGKGYDYFGGDRCGFIPIQKALRVQGDFPVYRGTPKTGVQEKGKTGSEHQQHQGNEKGPEFTVSHGHSLRCCQQCSGKSVRQWQ